MGRKDDIKDYLRGNRKGGTANRLERDALSDPFLFEALEGLTTTPGDPIDGLIRLERHLDERARASHKKNRGWLYAVASIFVVAMCGTLWYMQTGKDVVEPQMAQFRAGNGDATLTLSSGSMESLGKDSLQNNADTITKRQPRARLILNDGDAIAMDAVEEVKEVQMATGKQDSALALAKTKVAQNTVEGVVTDEKGEPLPGATVLISGTSLGGTTDARGFFRLQVPGEKVHLIFSFVGMKTQKMDVTAGERVQVKMNTENDKLDDVVVAGYTASRKKETAAVIPTIKIDTNTIVLSSDVTRFNRYVEQALQYPKEDLEKDNEGVIYVSFELNKKNTPSRIRIKDGFSKESNKELIRLLSNGPKWENSRIGVRIHATVRFTIGKDGAKNKAVLTIEKQKK